MSNGEHWEEATPRSGQKELSTFTPIRGLAVPVPHELRPIAGRTATYSWIQEPDGSWLDKTRGAEGPAADFQPYSSVTLEHRLEVAAQTIANWCREKTFASFKEARLAITLEHSNELWTPPVATPNDSPDIDPPSVQSDAAQPAVLVLGASRAQPRLYNAAYIFKEALPQFKAYNIASTQPGSFYAADARRGIVGPSVMPDDYLPFRRSFVRALVTEATAQAIAQSAVS